MDLFDLVAKITLDSSEYERGLDEAEKKTSIFSEVLNANLVTKGLEYAAKGFVDASKVAFNFVKSSVSAYGEYEQLVGGVETLFKDSAGIVQEYAANAYKTAGLSANQYMEMVTSFSASLLQSLGGDTERAAKIGDMAITDMADNVNKMGTSMEAVQNAYRGFSRGNFTMLDNLALGFAGTKEGMQELIDKANELRDAQDLDLRHLNINSYADIVQAIHEVQDAMGITGTTAKEASTTISGSIASMKSAWANLVTGMADENADFGSLVDNFVESVATVGSNLVPRVKQALTGVGSLITELSPVIAEQVPTLISDILPSLLEAGASLVSSLGSAIIENLPLLIDTGFQLILTLAQGIGEGFPELIPSIVGIILEIVNTLTDPANLSALVNGATAIIMGLANGLIAALPQLIAAVPQIIMNLAEAFVKGAQTIVTEFFGAMEDLCSSGVKDFGTSLSGWLDEYIIKPITNFFSSIWKKVSNFFAPLIEFISPLLNAIAYLFETVWQAIQIVTSRIFDSIKSKIESVWNGIKTFLSDKILTPIKGAVTKAFTTIYEKIKAPLNNIKSAITNVFNTIKTTISNAITNIVNRARTWGRDLLQNFVNGIRDKFSSLSNAITGVANKIRNLIGFSEPEEGPLSNFHTYAPDMMELFAKGIRDNTRLVTDQIEKSFDFGAAMPGVTGARTSGRTGRGGMQEVTPITLTVITELDGAVIARKTYKYNQAEIDRHGTSLVMA